MNYLLNQLFFLFKSILFTPHFLLFLISKKRQIIFEDVNSMSKYPSYKKRGISLLFYLLCYDKYFRSLFYMRIGVLSNLVSWYAPASETFFPCSNMGAGVYLAHPYATILNAKSIGKNFTCRQCTTIGNKKDGDNEGLPVIGDNVTLGANVIIIGNITIGDNVSIGAGSVVVHDIPSNSIAVGNPARIIKTNY